MGRRAILELIYMANTLIGQLPPYAIRLFVLYIYYILYQQQFQIFKYLTPSFAHLLPILQKVPKYGTKLYNNNYIYDNDTIDIKCMTCCKYTNVFTPYHYKFSLKKIVLLVPDKFVSEIWLKTHICGQNKLLLKNFLASFLPEIYTTLSFRKFGGKHIFVVRTNCC